METSKSMRISDHLPRGSEGAIPGEILREKLGFTKKGFHRQLEQEQIEGVPIFIKGGCYFLSDDTDEILKRARALRRRGEKALKIAKALETPILEERRKRFVREYNAV